MPITLLRLVLNRQKLTRDMPVDWRFYDNGNKQADLRSKLSESRAGGRRTAGRRRDTPSAVR